VIPLRHVPLDAITALHVHGARRAEKVSWLWGEQEKRWPSIMQYVFEKGPRDRSSQPFFVPGANMVTVTGGSSERHAPAACPFKDHSFTCAWGEKSRRGVVMVRAGEVLAVNQAR
jgi:hypothetical protein